MAPRPAPSVLALLLVVGLVAPAVAVVPSGDASSVARPVIPEANTTGYLDIDGATGRSGVTVASLDVTGAMAADTADLHSRYALRRFDAEFRAAPNESARQAVLRETANRLGTRIDTLRAREQAGREAHTAGELSTERYLRRMAILHADAEIMTTAVARLDLREDVTPGASVRRSRIARLAARLVTIRGPIRGLTVATASGTHQPMPVTVITSPDGVLLGTIDDTDGDSLPREFLSESYQASARNESAPNQFESASKPPLDAAEERARDQYPWAFENHNGYAIGFADSSLLRNAAVYTVTVNHPHGTTRRSDLVAYLDGGTTDVFREIQYKTVDELPVHRLGRNRSADLVLTVNATRRGGPMEIRTTDNSTNESVDASIYVDGVHVGSTGSDGQLWTVAPTGSVTVAAVTDSTRVTVSGSPNRP